MHLEDDPSRIIFSFTAWIHDFLYNQDWIDSFFQLCNDHTFCIGKLPFIDFSVLNVVMGDRKTIVYFKKRAITACSNLVFVWSPKKIVMLRFLILTGVPNVMPITCE